MRDHPFHDPTKSNLVIESYETSLRTTFLCAIVASVIMAALIVPIRLPRLRQGRQVVVSAGE